MKVIASDSPYLKTTRRFIRYSSQYMTDKLDISISSCYKTETDPRDSSLVLTFKTAEVLEYDYFRKMFKEIE